MRSDKKKSHYTKLLHFDDGLQTDGVNHSSSHLISFRNYLYVRAYLGGCVDPNCSIEQDMVTKLFEERCTVGKAIQVLGEGEELLQNRPGDVHPRRLRNNQEDL